jgi:hypothetical protein
VREETDNGKEKEIKTDIQRTESRKTALEEMIDATNSPPRKDDKQKREKSIRKVAETWGVNIVKNLTNHTNNIETVIEIEIENAIVMDTVSINNIRKSIRKTGLVHTKDMEAETTDYEASNDVQIKIASEF